MSSTLPLLGQRIRLRRLEDRDAAALFELYSDPEVMRYWNHAPWTAMAEARMAIAEAQADYASGASLHCVIEHAGEDRLIGSCALYALAAQHRCASLGYLLSRAHWGQGYLQEAMRLLLDHGFGALALNRIEAEVNCGNAASMRALEKLGFRREGCMRERWVVDAQACDTQLYGLLRKDWPDMTAPCTDANDRNPF